MEKKPLPLFLVASVVLSSFSNLSHCQSARHASFKPSLLKESKLKHTNIYARSAVGNLIGSVGVWGAYTLAADAFSDRKNIFNFMSCCSYFPVLIGGPIGSTLLLMAKPNPPIKSFKQSKPLLVISGLEMALYHLLYGGRKYRDGAQGKAIMGALLVGVTIVPLSQIWYLKMNRAKTEEILEGLFEDPKSLGLLSLNHKGIKLRPPGFWLGIPADVNTYWAADSTLRPNYFLSMFSFSL